MIRTESVVKRHDALVAVDHVTLELRTGVTAIIGPNGAGKSTLLAAIGRLIGTDSGVITVDDLDVTVRVLTRLAAEDGVTLSFPTVWRREDPWA